MNINYRPAGPRPLSDLRGLLWLVLIVYLVLYALPSRAQSQEATGGEVLLLEIDGVINPVTATYLTRGVEEATEVEAAAVVLRLNTPGGLESSMRRMTQVMLNSPVPIVVYVAPSGARAASAGMFLTVAAQVAAMAPGTNIGAAHPVGLGGEADPVMMEKLVSDAAALARALAETRERNGEWAEQAVRESVSITGEEAVELGVIDLLAGDLDELLAEIDGRRVTTPVGEVRLQTAGVAIIERPMSLAERILHTIADPNIAYILFTIGTIGLIAELYNPGILFPGITGLISLILAFVAFGSLPTSWAGLILLLVALGLFAAELTTEGTGLLAVGGLVAFVLGSLMLYRPLTPTSPVMPQVQVSPWLIGLMATMIGGFFLLVARAVLRARHAPVVTGDQALIGHRGVATSELAPVGIVRLGGELWSAVTEEEPIESGEEIEVIGVEGVTLRVRRGHNGEAAGPEA